MKIPTIFKLVWTVYGAVVFGVILIPSFTLLLILHTLMPGQPRIFYSVPGLISKWSLFFFGVVFTYLSKWKPDTGKQFIYIFNHHSNLDPLLAASITIGFSKFIGKAEVLNYPIFGYMLRHFYVSVDRTDKSDRYKSLVQLEEAISEGASIVIFPEATRNTSKDLLGPYKLGAFRLSLKTKTPIAMMTFLNSGDRMAPGNWLLSPGKLYCKWDYIDWSENGYSEENIEALGQHAWNIMHDNLNQYKQDTNA